MKFNNPLTDDKLSVHVVEVIMAVRLRGDGTEEYPMRTVVSYYRMDGTLIAEVDPYNDEELPEVKE